MHQQQHSDRVLAALLAAVTKQRLVSSLLESPQLLQTT
jgi:hypothetical protein